MIVYTKEQENPKEQKFVDRAYKLFGEFYRNTADFRMKCKNNEEYWKANHWSEQSKKDPDEPRPVTPVLFSTLESMLADIMDSYPEPLLLGQEEGDERAARELSEIIQYILKRRNYREVYRAKSRQALKKGASVQEIYWDRTLCDGLGDINIRNWDIKNFLWDYKCEDIQDGRACFKFSFYPKEWYEDRYPDMVKKFRPDGYTREDAISGAPDEDIMLMEYWYKKYDRKTGRTSCHMALLAGNTLLEKSEDVKPSGMYAHGMYPFVVEPLYPIEGQPVGMGMIDIFKNMQTYADKLDQIILKNALMSSRVKLLVNRAAELDEEALCDWNREIVRGSRIDDGSVRWFQPQPLNPAVMTHFLNKLQGIKEESGQTMFSRGEGGKGITAATAILALQEAGNKRSRMIIETLFDGFEKLVRIIVSLIAEFYSEQRRFRITGGEEDYTLVFNNKRMLKQIDDSLQKHIEFDVKVNVQKQTPFRTLYQNELALQLLQNGIVNQEEALEMMTFEGRDKVLNKVHARISGEMETAALQAAAEQAMSAPQSAPDGQAMEETQDMTDAQAVLDAAGIKQE